MKTSIKLLIILALGLLVALFGAAISIRQQFDSIDKNDPYARWQKKSLPTFSAIQITGPSALMVQIEPGNTTRLLADTLNKWRQVAYTYHVDRDTLFLTIAPAAGWLLRPEDTDDEWRNPQLIVQAPALTAVSATNAVCQISDLQGNLLTLTQGGKAGRMTLEHLNYNQLNASLSSQCQLTIRSFNNRISRANITVRDSARLFQYSDFTNGFTLQADSTAMLRLTGKALRQMREK